MDYLFGFFFPSLKKNSVVSFLCIDAIKNGWDKEERGKVLPVSNSTRTRYHKLKILGSQAEISILICIIQQSLM